MSKKLNIIYMGTPDFSVPALQALITSPHDIVAVYTQPPRPKGRGHKMQKSPVQEVAEVHNIPVFTPVSFKKDIHAIEIFQSHTADLAIVAAYGLILPQSVLDAPVYGCVNIHASLLPRWRGAAPIQYAIWKGDQETGVTIMQMEAGLDTGPMITKRSCPITQETTAHSLHDELSVMGAEMILPCLDNFPLQGESQEGASSNYASLLTKEDGKIDWTQTAQDIDRQIRALNPWPSTYCDTLKIKKATLSDQTSPAPVGTVLDKDGHIVCGAQSVLKLKEIQPQNKKAMDFLSALNGGYLKVGARLS